MAASERLKPVTYFQDNGIAMGILVGMLDFTNIDKPVNKQLLDYASAIVFGESP